MSGPKPLLLHVPGEIAAFARRRGAAGRPCVVIDQLRATSTIVTALARGAKRVLAVGAVEAARAVKAERPDALLAGERLGTAPEGFDLGNSPFEYTEERVRGREIVLTTTNGTFALLACAGASSIRPASLLNLGAVARTLAGADDFVVICSGSDGKAALEDEVTAGAFLTAVGLGGHPAAAPFRAWGAGPELQARAANGRRLVGLGLAKDIVFCAQRDHFPIVPEGRIVEIRTGGGPVPAVEIFLP